MSQDTLSIVKPDAVGKNHTGQILARIEAEGLQLVAVQKMRLGQAQAEAFYAEHKARPFFADLVRFMISGPVVVSVLRGPDAVARYRKLMGATDPAKAEANSLRKAFGANIENNAVHGSDAVQTAAREIAFFFSGSALSAVS